VALLAPQFGLAIAAKFLVLVAPLTSVNALFAAAGGNFNQGIGDLVMMVFNLVATPVLTISGLGGYIGERRYAAAISFDFLREGNKAAYFFIWFMFPINAWILKQKGRSSLWLGLAFFFVPYVSLILGNKITSKKNEECLEINKKKSEVV
jgi:hypothetical protein